MCSTRSRPAPGPRFDGVTDPHNLGACLRRADGAGAHAVVARVTGPWASMPPLPGGQRRRRDRAPSDGDQPGPHSGRAQGARHLGVGTSDSAERSIYDLDLNRPVALVLGAEGEGMRQLTAKTQTSSCASPWPARSKA